MGGLLALAALCSCQPPCNDDAAYHQVDLTRWCSVGKGCLQNGEPCPSYGCVTHKVAAGDGFELSYPFDQLVSDVPLDALSLELTFSTGATPNFTLHVAADGVEVCSQRVHASIVKIVCRIPLGTAVVTVDSVDLQPGFGLHAIARERTPTAQGERCGL